jgi:hypothetical protein
MNKNYIKLNCKVAPLRVDYLHDALAYGTGVAAETSASQNVCLQEYVPKFLLQGGQTAVRNVK